MAIKKTLVSRSKSTESSSSSGNLAGYPMKGKVGARDQRPYGNKVVTPEDTPPRGARKKNPHISPL